MVRMVGVGVLFGGLFLGTQGHAQCTSFDVNGTCAAGPAPRATFGPGLVLLQLPQPPRRPVELPSLVMVQPQAVTSGMGPVDCAMRRIPGSLSTDVKMVRPAGDGSRTYSMKTMTPTPCPAAVPSSSSAAPTLVR